jgi:hypothetical protein
MREKLNALLAQLRASAQAILASVGSGAKQIWDSSKGIIIGVGALLLVAKFRDLLMALLVRSSKKTLESAQKQDAQLKAQEDQANAQANQLINDANKLEADKKPVTDDWYKNGK